MSSRSQPKDTLLRLAGKLQSFSAVLIEDLHGLVDFADSTSIASFVNQMSSLPASKILLPLLQPLSPLGAVAAIVIDIRAPSTLHPPPLDRPAPYRQAARMTPAPLRRLPVIGRRSPTHDDPTAPHLGPSLQRRLRNTARYLRGFDDKTFVTVTTPPDARPFANPRRLREALTDGGFPAPIVPSQDPRVSFLCAGEEHLTHTVAAYTNFCESCDVRMPKITVSAPHELAEQCATSSDVCAVLQPLVTEASRLESTSCPWHPRNYFASYLRQAQQRLLTRLRELQPDHPAISQFAIPQPCEAVEVAQRSEPNDGPTLPPRTASNPPTPPVAAPPPKRNKTASRDPRMVDNDDAAPSPPSDGFVHPRNVVPRPKPSAPNTPVPPTGGQFAALAETPPCPAQ